MFKKQAPKAMAMRRKQKQPGDSAAVTFLSPTVGGHLTFEMVT